MFRIIHHHHQPVLHKGSRGTEDNQFGFEGGTVVKLGDRYYLFTSEMAGDPMWVKMRLALWVGVDRLHFQRLATLFESSGDYTGQDDRAALWSPMPTFNEKENCWNLTYVAYRCAPDNEQGARRNFAGRIWRAKSQTEGREGIAGPYIDEGVILEPGVESDSWEGLQGTDSFYPYQANGKWYAFYGSANTQNNPIDFWGVGLAEAPELAGPWKRCSQLNPVLIDERFVENPIVTLLDNGKYVAFYDGGPLSHGCKGTIGYSLSDDGLQWSKGDYLYLDPDQKSWQDSMRTPLCLIREGNGNYTVYYTAMSAENYGCIGMLSLEWV